MVETFIKCFVSTEPFLVIGENSQIVLQTLVGFSTEVRQLNFLRSVCGSYLAESMNGKKRALNCI
jgi:hypothetical protein